MDRSFPVNKLLFFFQVITYFAGRVFDPNEAERGRVAFAGEYLKGDASLMISDLSLTDSGEYSCKVKTGAQYHWSTIRLIVLGRWQTHTAERILYKRRCHENPKLLASLSATLAVRKCLFQSEARASPAKLKSVEYGSYLHSFAST